MLELVIGKKGSGKSCYLTREAYYLSKKGYEIYTNYPIKLPNWHPLDLSKVKEMMQYSNLVVGIDEAEIYMDARSSSSKLNKNISYLLAQSRKRNMRIYVLSQMYRELDLRARMNFEIVTYVYPYSLIAKGVIRRSSIKDIYNKNVQFIKVKKFLSSHELLETYFFPSAKYYELYDSYQIFSPMQETKSL